MTDTSAISRDVHAYILQEFLPGENPDNLTESTALMRGIVDSIATLKLVGFLEEKYGIQVEAHELNVNNFNTIADIARYVHSKLPKA
jgi:acyl carrier protein